MKGKWSPLLLWDWLSSGRWAFLLYKKPITEELHLAHFWHRGISGCRSGFAEESAAFSASKNWIWLLQCWPGAFKSCSSCAGVAEQIQDKAVPAHSEVSRWLLCQAAVCQLNLAFSFPWSMNRFFPQILFYFSVSSAVFFFPVEDEICHRGLDLLTAAWVALCDVRAGEELIVSLELA